MKSKLQIFLALVGLFTGLQSSAQTKSEAIDELLTAYTQKEQFNGTALVLHQGKQLLLKGYGWRDVEEQLKNNAHTTFQIGSVTKQFTATIVLKLAERGKLSLNDRLNKYFPEINSWDSITIHQLLNHSSGIYNYTDNGDFIQNKSSIPASRAEMLNLFKDQPLQFRPGSQWAYSNSGYLLLGYIIEMITRKPYEKVVREMIFQPLGMTHSGFDFAHLKATNKSIGYFSIAARQKGTMVDSTVSFAAGAMYSTAEDMQKWHNALLNNSIIKRQSLEKAFKPYQNNFGYGWVIENYEGKKAVYHNGSILGFTSNIYRIESDNTCIILLCNIGTPKIDVITKGILAILYNQPYTHPGMLKAIPLSQESMQAYLGVFEFSPRFKASITKSLNKMYAQRIGENQKHLLTPIGPNRFFVNDVDQELEFVPNENGVIVKAILHTGDQPMIAPKIQEYQLSLQDTILQLDKAMFEAYNNRELDKLMGYFSKDLEFYHDTGGLNHYEHTKSTFDQNFKSGKIIHRSLVDDGVEVYPIKGYGAVLKGEHTFCQSNNGEKNCQTVKFVHVWKRTGQEWQITRVISFDH